MRQIMDKLPTRVLAGVLAPVIGATCLGLAGCESGPSNKAEGTVVCPVGEPVEGVWIDAGTGQGWATWSIKNSSNPNVATYRRDVSAPTNYSVRVGCSGTPNVWEHADYGDRSAPSNTEVTWQCGPDPKQVLARIGICSLEGGTGSTPSTIPSSHPAQPETSAEIIRPVWHQVYAVAS